MVMNPGQALEKMIDGKLSLEEMDALRATSPKLMAYVQELVMEEAEKQEKITFAQKEKIKRILEQADPYQNVAQIQLAFQGEEQAPKGVNIKTRDLADNMRPRSDRLKV
ncbi:MAG: hypothetical protein HC875_10520 [Anaerolineales bacterium]|nr:hypothetical protein [Anaerolineales bacterium]